MCDQGVDCVTEAATSMLSPRQTQQAHIAQSPKSEPADSRQHGTSLYGDTIMGRKGPVQSKDGKLKFRPLPFCVTYAHVWDPGL